MQPQAEQNVQEIEEEGNEEAVKPGGIDDIYDTIDDDPEPEPEPEPVRPPVPPKPIAMKRKPKQQAKVVKLVPSQAMKTQPSTDEEWKKTISKLIF